MVPQSDLLGLFDGQNSQRRIECVLRIVNPLVAWAAFCQDDGSRVTCLEVNIFNQLDVNSIWETT